MFSSNDAIIGLKFKFKKERFTAIEGVEVRRIERKTKRVLFNSQYFNDPNRIQNGDYFIIRDITPEHIYFTINFRREFNYITKKDFDKLLKNGNLLLQ